MENFVPPAAETPVPQKSSSGKPVLWGVLLFIAGLVIGGAVVWFYAQPSVEGEPSLTASPAASPSPTPSPTSAATPIEEATIFFRNERYGFQLNYPVDWRVAEGTNNWGFGPKSMPEDTVFGIWVVNSIPELGPVPGSSVVMVVSKEETTFSPSPANPPVPAILVTFRNDPANAEWAVVYLPLHGAIYAIGQPTLPQSPDFPSPRTYNDEIRGILDTLVWVN